MEHVTAFAHTNAQVSLLSTRGGSGDQLHIQELYYTPRDRSTYVFRLCVTRWSLKLRGVGNRVVEPML
jgi:hypothetical protein